MTFPTLLQLGATNRKNLLEISEEYKVKVCISLAPSSCEKCKNGAISPEGYHSGVPVTIPCSLYVQAKWR